MAVIRMRDGIFASTRDAALQANDLRNEPLITRQSDAPAVEQRRGAVPDKTSAERQASMGA